MPWRIFCPLVNRRIASAVMMAVSFSISGCVVLPIPTGQESHQIIEQATFDEMRGAKRADVEARLGEPYSQLGDSNGRYLIYRGGINYEYFDLVFPVTPPQVFIPYYLIAAATVEDEDKDEKEDPYAGDTHCYLFELDDNDTLRSIQSRKEPDLDCESAFFTPTQLKDYTETREELRLKGIQEDDPEARKNLINWFGDIDTDELRKEHLKFRYERGDDSYETRIQLAELGVPQPLEELAKNGDLQASIDLLRISGKWQPLKKLADRGNEVAAKMLSKHSKAPRRMIGGLSPYEIFQLAESGDADAQLQLYYDPNTDDPHIWLCRTADNGHAEARYRLANLYEFGSEGFPKDWVLAQVWYRLAAYTGHVWGNTNALRLAEMSSSSDIERVRTLEQEWQPGQCEIDLGKREAD